MLYIVIKEKYAGAKEKVFKAVDADDSPAIIPHLAGIDFKRFAVDVVSEDGESEWGNDDCWEWCPCCNAEDIAISPFGISYCPNCGNPILPCAMCDCDINDCRNCPYSDDVWELRDEVARFQRWGREKLEV